MKTEIPWKPQYVNLALAQFAMQDEPKVNLDTALSYIAEAAKKQADIVCLPELFRSPYFCIEESCKRDYAEPIPGEVLPALQKAAKELGVAIVGGSIYEKTPEGKLFNTSLVIDKKGEFLGSYRKIHIPHDPAFFECNYFASGDLGFKVFDLGFAKISVLICYDQWFPEAARVCALNGAQIIFYPTAIGTNSEVTAHEGDWQNAWETVQRGHAVANSVVVATVNRVGQEDKSTFWGGSFVSDAFGHLVNKAGNEPTLLMAKVDLAHSKFTKDSWRFMVSRRPENYAQVSEK